MRAPSCIKALVAATIPVMATGCGEINADRAEFRTDQVSANGKQFAFMHVLYAQRKTIIVIADDDTHSIKTFMSSPQQQASLWSAMLLSDKSFYVTASPLRNPPISPEGLHSTLYHCAVGEMPCERLFSADNSIDTPVKSAGRLYSLHRRYLEGCDRTPRFGSTQQLMYVDFNFYRFANGAVAENYRHQRLRAWLPFLCRNENRFRGDTTHRFQSPSQQTGSTVQESHLLRRTAERRCKCIRCSTTAETLHSVWRSIRRAAEPFAGRPSGRL